LLLAPLAWARIMRWEIRRRTTGRVPGRSLGLSYVSSLHMPSGCREPSAQPFFFELMLWLFVGMIGLHIYGAIKRTQPITETIEIGLWVMLLLVTLVFYPSG